MSESGSAVSAIPKAEYIPSHGRGRLKPFEPGKSGNPSGYGGLYNDVRKYAAENTMAAIKKIVELVDCPDGRVAFIAAQTVLERAVGKPRDHSAEESVKSQVDLSALSDDQRATLALLLSKVLGFK